MKIMKYLLTIITLSFSLQSMAKDKILIFSKEQEDFNKLSEFLMKELGTGYDYAVVKIDKAATQESFEGSIKTADPKLIVLMDNQTVAMGKTYFEKNPKSKIKGVALMGLNYKKILKGNPNICGIAYEVSSFSLLTQFRNIRSDKKLKTVLTFYRSSQFSDSIQEAIDLAKMEKIDLVAIDVDKKEDVLTYLKSEGAKEINSGKYDAVYVLLDSVLLEKKAFLEFWLPTAKEAKIPFLIGTEKFVNPNFDFAVFGLSPNLKELASQSAQMIESLMGGDKCYKIEDLVGVNGYWNLKKGDNLGISVDENAKSEVNLLK